MTQPGSKTSNTRAARAQTVPATPSPASGAGAARHRECGANAADIVGDVVASTPTGRWSGHRAGRVRIETTGEHVLAPASPHRTAGPQTGAAPKSWHAGRGRLRRAGAADLPAINTLVADAMSSWALPARVRRLTLPLFRYETADLDVMTLIVTETVDGTVTGVAACEAGAAVGHAPSLTLHGLFVAGDAQRAGIGTRLLAAACSEASRLGLAWLRVSAWREAEGFFLERGFHDTPGSDQSRLVRPRRLCRATP